jgi:hypothetical protein
MQSTAAPTALPMSPIRKILVDFQKKWPEVDIRRQSMVHS